jgi:hypothetical protein
MKMLLVAGFALFAWGCDQEGSRTTSVKDHLIVDDDAPPAPEMIADGEVGYGYAADGGPIDLSDAQRYGTVADAYALPSVCGAQCTCEAGTFCFGGSSSSPPFSGTCDHATGYDLGCNPVPNGCTDCACLLQALGNQLPMPCTPRCSPANGMTVLCD